MMSRRQDPPGDAFLTTQQVASRLDFSRRTIYRLIKAGEIPFRKVGREWRIHQSEFEAWWAAQPGVRLTMTTPMED